MKLFSKAVVLFYISDNMDKGSGFSSSSPAVGREKFLNAVVILTGAKWYIIMVLIDSSGLP